VLSQPRYPGGLAVAEITRRLRAATDAPDHRFWPDALTFCDPDRFRLDDVATPRSLTDLYLLALSVENQGRPVTFDQGVPMRSIVGAEDRHLVVL
jgi:predicted nucleic acid-binding protein